LLEFFLKTLHLELLWRKGLGESDEADDIRDDLDGLWYSLRLNNSEREILDHIEELIDIHLQDIPKTR